MKILSFGEILWDIFDNGEKKIGGAPFNFAAHCAKLGAESFIVSALGDDENGKAALEEAKRLGIKTDYIYTHRRYKTGFCNITLENGKPNYDLILDTAYDHIPDIGISDGFDAVYMGTLALRNADSRRSFEKLIKYIKAKEIFFDVNFRGNFYTRELVDKLMNATSILKVSDEEIGFFGRRDLVNTCVEIGKKYPKLKYICVTLGKDGAAVYDCRKRAFYLSDKPKGEAVSTVGAGDSFAAAFLVSYLEGMPIEACLDRGVALSDFVVTQLGAVPEYDKNCVFKQLT